MPKYFFQLTDQGTVYHDSEGMNLADDEAARHEAALALSEIARDVLIHDGLLHEFEIIVRDEHGGTVWRTTLDFAAEAGSAHSGPVV